MRRPGCSPLFLLGLLALVCRLRGMGRDAPGHTVTPGGPDEGQGQGAAVCAYRTAEGGDEGRLCFRHTLPNFTCESNTCRQVRAAGGRLVANVLSNGTVLLAWTYPPPGEPWQRPPRGGEVHGTARPRGGFRMSCRWNGSYTQFECASVHLSAGCRDYLLSELRPDVAYRVCLRPAPRPGPGECVEFSLPPAGMQDVVMAMMAVGGAICVMLVVICLLVAYITENIMSPSVHHAPAAQTSRRSHSTYL